MKLARVIAVLFALVFVGIAGGAAALACTRDSQHAAFLCVPREI